MYRYRRKVQDDEGENVDAAGGDQRRHDRSPLAVDRVDDAGWKSLGEGGEERLEEENADLRADVDALFAQVQRSIVNLPGRRTVTGDSLGQG